MATSSAVEKWEIFDQDDDEEEEEEALSLCDLPVNLIKAEAVGEDDKAEAVEAKHEEDFDFGPLWGGSTINRSEEMCAAEDIFFQGQILPLRFSVSSEPGVLTKLKRDASFNYSSSSQSLSRSESLDHSSQGGFTSFSTSRSSSCSRSSSNSSMRNNIPSKQRIIQSQLFHSHPSPKPQLIRHSSSTSLAKNAASTGTSTRRKSSMWDFFRLGLVRTPEIELQDLKARCSVSRNSSSSSSNNSTNNNSSSSQTAAGKKTKQQQQQHSRKQRLLSGCSCSVSAVKPVPINNVAVIKRSTIDNNNNNTNITSTENKEEKTKKKQQPQQQKGKQTMSRHRTFEWIKELSHASYVEEDDDDNDHKG